MGIRQTNNATIIVIDGMVPSLPALYLAKGSKVTVANRKTIVNPESKILRAISFGVF